LVSIVTSRASKMRWVRQQWRNIIR
jgi:hypothetical protein